MNCVICEESITKKRHLIECPYCEDGTVCVECARRYLLLETADGGIEPGERGCMICKKKWDYDYIEYMFGISTAQKYVELCKIKLLEREKSMFASTQPFVEYAKLKKNVIETNKNLSEIKNGLLDRVREIETEIIHNTAKLRDSKPSSNIETYIMACPKTDTCKGFVNSKTFSCGLCSTKVCEKCRVVIYDPEEKKGKTHRCKSADIQSVKLIEKDTKCCPGCATRIQKLDGCSQMFCTKCMTAFNWDTLKIVTGAIHNPHYYDLVRKGVITNSRRVPGDIPSGGIPDFWMLGVNIRNLGKKLYDSITLYHRFALEVEEYLIILADLKSYNDLFTDLRVKYILGDIKSEKDYKDALYELKIFVQKCEIEKEALETLIIIFSERYVTLMDTIKEIRERKTIVNTSKGKKKRMIPLKQRIGLIESAIEKTIEELDYFIEITNETFASNGIDIINLPDDDVAKKGDIDILYLGLREEEIRDRDMVDLEYNDGMFFEIG